MSGSNFTTGAPEIDQSTLGQVHVLKANDYSAASPEIDPPSFSTRSPVAGAGRLEATATAAAHRTQFEQKLLETPAEIRDAAQNLAGAIDDQIHVLNASKPNEGDDLTKHNAFVDFLAFIARELRRLAEALDRAIAAAASAPVQQRMFLGTAGKIADRLQIAFGDWFEQNATNVAGYSIRIGLFAAAFGFLRACGVDGDVATLASAILNKSIPEQK